MSFIAPFDGFNTVVNVLMATGPILVPPAVAAAGLSLGILILLMMAVISSITASYVIECLAACNMLETLTESDELPLLNMNNDSLQEITISNVDMEKTYEIGAMGNISYGRFGLMFNTIVMVAYLYGIIITKGIIVGNTISALFLDIPVLNSFYFWISVFYLVCGVLSFRDVANIAIAQTIIGVMRYLTLYTMVMAAAQTIAFDKSTDIPIERITEFDIYKFANLFSNVVLGFMNHHSIPSMLRPIRPSSEIIKIAIIPFAFAFVVYVLICSTGMFAFPYLSLFCQYNIAFDVPLTSVSYFVVSFYIFLNISGVPVQVIVARKNMIQLCAPDQVTNDYINITWTSAAFTLLVVMPCYIIAVALKNSIHLVIGITGGICGVLLLMVIPSFMVINFRTRVAHNRFASFITNDITAYAIGISGIAFAVYNCYIAIINIINGSHCFQNHAQFEQSLNYLQI